MGIIRWLQLGRLLKPLVAGVEKLEQGRQAAKMTVGVNYIVQVIALLLQTLNQVTEILPPKGQFYAAVGITVLQGISAVLAHFNNPDGTKASVAWEKAQKGQKKD